MEPRPHHPVGLQRQDSQEVVSRVVTLVSNCLAHLFPRQTFQTQHDGLFYYSFVIAKSGKCLVGPISGIYSPLFSLYRSPHLLPLLSVILYTYIPSCLCCPSTQACLYLLPSCTYLLLIHLQTNMALQGSAPTDAYQFANYLKTVEPKSRSNSEPADNAKSFIICHRDDSAERDFRYSHDNPVAVCVTNCINLCRSMLENHEVRNAFTTIAEDYSQKSAIACPEHEGDMSRVTDDFIQKIRNEFPIVFVNNSWKNPRMMTAQFRQPSCGSFRSCNHYILMNGTVRGNQENLMNKVLEQADQTLDS